MEDTEVDLFPGGTASNNNGPQTPPRNDHLNAAAPGELSPPRSQGNDTAATTNGNVSVSATSNGNPAVGDMQEPMSNAAAASGVNNNGNSSTGNNGYSNGNNASNTWQPGEWRNKKNAEETARAWDYVVEPNWNANQYGDVMERARQARSGT
jgi:hypothetical protein